MSGRTPSRAPADRWCRQSGHGGAQPLLRAFAAYLHAAGCEVLTYDYRGIGGSRPARLLRGFRAGWIEWGSLDFEGACVKCSNALPGSRF